MRHYGWQVPGPKECGGVRDGFVAIQTATQLLDLVRVFIQQLEPAMVKDGQRQRHLSACIEQDKHKTLARLGVELDRVPKVVHFGEIRGDNINLEI